MAVKKCLRILNKKTSPLVEGFSSTGDEYVGGFSGYSSQLNGSVDNSYYNIETSGNLGASGDLVDTYGHFEVESKTTAEMIQKATFEDWDFNNIWGISNEINNGYPYLLSN